jgi:hypothetical protein
MLKEFHSNFWNDSELKDFKSVFSWTVTYKRDSDIRLLSWSFKERKESLKEPKNA